MLSETIRVHAALIAVSLIYGYFYVAVKLLLQDMQPGQFILLRFVLTALLVAVILPRTSNGSRPQGAELMRIILLGLLGVFLVQILVVWGLHQTTAFHSALIMATIPIMTMAESILLGRETFHPQKLIGIITGFAGVCVLLFFTKDPGSPLPATYLQGDFIVLLNAFAFSWFLLGSQKALQTCGSFAFMAYCYIASAVLFSLLYTGLNFTAGHGLGLAFLGDMTPNHWLLTAFVVIFASIGSYTLNNYALKRVNPSIVALYIFIQPVISAVTGFYLLGEPFNLQMGIATLITFGGVMLATSATNKGVYIRPGNQLHADIPESRTALAAGTEKDSPTRD